MNLERWRMKSGAAPAGRVPAKTRLGPRSEVHRVGSPTAAVVDADDFQQPRRKNPRRYERRQARQTPPRHRSSSHNLERRRYEQRQNAAPEEGAGLCHRCLQPGHVVRDCTAEVRCRRRLYPGHESWQCDVRRNERGELERSLPLPRTHSGHRDLPPSATAPPPPPPPPKPASAPPATALAPAGARAAPTPAPADSDGRSMAPFQRPAPTPPAPSRHAPAATPPPPPPGPPRVILSRTVEMAEAEDVLRLAMVASITGTRPRVAISAVERLLCSHFKLHPDDFTVHLHHPEDFLLTFHSKTAYDCIAGDHFLNDANFCLSVRPWCKLAHAKLGRMDYHVELELRGIPAHAWHVSTAEHLLGGS
uniref:Uncharacterized protein n=1 Tax=Avena sativa TaxID=4498 RepID=A0ACD5ZZ12_AVESA